MTTPPTAATPPLCPFCHGSAEFVHWLNRQPIYRCEHCDTITTHPKPSPETLRSYYQGFRFQGLLQNYDLVKTETTRTWMASHVAPAAQLLDFGGGGGFYAKAFEDFGLGQATYIDIDHEACRFAKHRLKLENVVNGSLDTLSRSPQPAFDLIICRHVIEHLPHPVATIDRLIDLLSPGGTLVLSCPNGTSKEGLLYPTYWRKFVEPLARSNGWSLPRSLWCSFTGDFGWGMDPPRHLWAISPRALHSTLVSRADIHFTLKTASLAAPLYSPYHSSGSQLGRWRDRVAALLFGGVLEGMHLIAEIRRS